jgi:hypothetical protein
LEVNNHRQSDAVNGKSIGMHCGKYAGKYNIYGYKNDSELLSFYSHRRRRHLTRVSGRGDLQIAWLTCAMAWDRDVVLYCS